MIHTVNKILDRLADDPIKYQAGGVSYSDNQISFRLHEELHFIWLNSDKNELHVYKNSATEIICKLEKQDYLNLQLKLLKVIKASKDAFETDLRLFVADEDDEEL
jgi:hypothetical protein